MGKMRDSKGAKYNGPKPEPDRDPEPIESNVAQDPSPADDEQPVQQPEQPAEEMKIEEPVPVVDEQPETLADVGNTLAADLKALDGLDPISGEYEADPDVDPRTVDTAPEYTVDPKLFESSERLPYAAFSAAAKRYFPCLCIIHAYKKTDAGTVVVLSAGRLGVRKEVIGA